MYCAVLSVLGRANRLWKLGLMSVVTGVYRWIGTTDEMKDCDQNQRQNVIMCLIFMHSTVQSINCVFINMASGFAAY